MAVSLRSEVLSLRHSASTSLQVESALRAELYSSRSQLSVAKSKISDLRIKLQASNSTIATLKSNVNRQALSIELQNENESEGERARVLLMEKRKECQILERKVEELKKDNRALRGEEVNKKELVQLLQLKDLKLKNMAAQYNADLTAVGQDFSDLTLQNDQLREKIKRKKEVLKQQRELLLDLSGLGGGEKEENAIEIGENVKIDVNLTNFKADTEADTEADNEVEFVPPYPAQKQPQPQQQQQQQQRERLIHQIHNDDLLSLSEQNKKLREILRALIFPEGAGGVERMREREDAAEAVARLRRRTACSRGKIVKKNVNANVKQRGAGGDYKGYIYKKKKVGKSGSGSGSGSVSSKFSKADILLNLLW